MLTLGLLIWALIVIVLFKLYQKYVERQVFLSRIAHIPGPPSRPLVGNGLDFKGTTDVLPVMMQYTKEYGPTYRLFLGADTNIVTSDLKFIEFLVTSTTQITKSLSYRFLDKWLGTGLLTASNPKWKKHRRLLTPTFHFKILNDCIPIFHSNAQNLIEHWKGSNGKMVDIHKDVLLCSLDVICETAMGNPIGALKQRNGSHYVKAVKHMTKMVVERTFSIWRQFDWIYQMSPEYQADKKNTAFLHGVTEGVIKVKRQRLAEKESKESKDNEEDLDDSFGKNKLAFLDLLLKCSTEEGGTLTNEEIRQEVDTFMFAGHDTISSGMSFTLYLLSQHQDVQEKAFEEVSKILGEDNTITMEKLNEMKYLEMVIKESLRLFPPVPMIGREFTDNVVYDGEVYPKGLQITILLYAVHRCSEIYEEPNKFNPERFTSENCAKRSNYAYLPFSAGPRNCIGQKFAMLEMKSMLSSLLLKFRFKPSNEELQIASETVLTSLNGINVHIETR